MTEPPYPKARAQALGLSRAQVGALWRLYRGAAGWCAESGPERKTARTLAKRAFVTVDCAIVLTPAGRSVARILFPDERPRPGEKGKP